ncbi:hypothetical protein [Paraflavitalea speifideaquila]|uniref:hypothetical protein n=1 Tax=Paraflavitalea speifideaquila TaxID=3076558 RepID=UPI0028E22DEF|nr:hypothetical protein [Paraflavitalea speifideiaquila]
MSGFNKLPTLFICLPTVCQQDCCNIGAVNIEVLELPIDKALEMIATGEIKDAKTIMQLQYAQLNKLL